ncbi:MAG: GNAT family N-acetyltransferase [Nocardioides sp.]|nr:GNAT family N-acetyltransferase [Nocardioides sp.]
MPEARRHRPRGLGPHVVGQRVVVRRVLPGETGPSGGPAMTDVLGVCTSWSLEYCVVQPSTGPAVTIALADIVSGKPVPPRPSVRQRVSPHDAQSHVASLWDDLVTEPLGEWVLRVAPPYDGRLRRRGNSVLAMGSPGASLPEAAAHVMAFYARHDRRPLAQVVSDGDVESSLLGLGWAPLGSGDAHCQLASVSRVLRSCNAELGRLGYRQTGIPVDLTPRYMEEGSRIEVTLGGGTARGRAALDGDWVGLYSLEVDPAHRRRGLATVVLKELLDWAASRGATTAWLHVETDNPGAIALYERLGFVTHHTTRYLAAP